MDIIVPSLAAGLEEIGAANCEMTTICRHQKHQFYNKFIIFIACVPYLITENSSRWYQFSILASISFTS